MRAMYWGKILVLPLLFAATPAFAAIPFPNLAPDQHLQAIGKLQNSRVAEIVFENPKAIPDNLRSKFMALKGRNFSPGAIREIIVWFQNTIGDTRIEVYADEAANEVELRIRLKERSKISSVKFVGLNQFSSSALQALMDVKEGEDLDPSLLDSSLQKIANYFAAHGHLGAAIQADFTKDGTLEVKVDEGEPTTLDSVSISEINTVENKEFRRRLQESIASAFSVKRGDRLDKENIDTGLENIKAWLHGHDFLLAKEPQLEVEKISSGKARLKIAITYGPRIKFGFRENKILSQRELMAIIDEVKEVAVGSDYLDSIRRKIIDSYKELGFVNVEINTVVREDAERGIRYISLVVDEGDKVRISKVNIDGVHAFSPKETLDLFYSFASRLVQREYYQEAGVKKAGELLADHLRSLGYLSAKLEFARAEFSKDKKSASVHLLFSEGQQTKIEEFNIVGLKNLSSEEAFSFFQLKPGDPLNIFAFEKGIVALKDKYQDLGFLNMRVENEGTESVVKYSRDQTKAHLSLVVNEGSQVRVGEVIVRGNTQTHARVVVRELPFTTGDVLTRPLLREAEDNIRKLNLFGSVIVRAIDHPSSDSQRDILILIEETEPGSLEFAPGYRNDLGVRTSLGISYQNLGGWHRGISARAILNRRLENYRFIEYNTSIGFREPYFVGWPVTLSTSVNFIRREYSSFDAKISKFIASFSRNFSSSFTGFIEYSFERLTIDNIRNVLYSTESDAGTKDIGAITPGFIFDTRDNKFNPSSGIISSNRFELASSSLGSRDKRGELGYYRLVTSNSFYRPLLGDVVFAGAVNLGFERSNVFGQPIPLTKLFRLGGLSSIRGYRDDIIEVETQSVINGTLALVNYRGELRIPLSGSVGTALFVDAGNLNIDNFQPFTLLRASAGMGLRYTTPVGPVVLDVAWKLQRKPSNLTTRDTDRYRIHFAIGTF